MRLWEIKKTIRECINENHQLVIDHEAIYWNQAYKIKNYGKLVEVFDVLYEQKWNDANVENINAIVEEFGTDADIVQISTAQFNQLNSYVSQLNNKLPLYYSILETMAEDQEEQIINIKIPDKNVSSLKDLSDFNNRLNKIFESFRIDWQFEFKGLDKWTSRYEILVIWVMTYRFFLSCLKIAKEFLETTKTYYEWKKAKLDYLASLKKDEKFNETAFTEYKEKRIELEIDDKIQETIKNLPVKNWKSEAELQTQLIIATKGLIKELWEGTEFHLSLNPPTYAYESWSSLEIDYKKISALIAEENKPKKLENKSKKEDETIEQ